MSQEKAKARGYCRQDTGISEEVPSEIITRSADETKSLGERLARRLRCGDVLALTGGLGSGKTVFTKGIAAGLGVAHPEYVNSPSFVLIKRYKGKTNLYHLDLYRLDEPSDVEYIGLHEYLAGDGIVVIEWPEKIMHCLPDEYLQINIDIIGRGKRCLSFRAHGKRLNTVIRGYIKQQV